MRRSISEFYTVCNPQGLLVAWESCILLNKDYIIIICDPQNNWVPRRGEQGPKTIDQIHKEAELEEHREQVKVQQQLLSKKEGGGGGGGRMGGSMGGRGSHTPGGGRTSQPQDEGWNTVPISKNRPIDTTRLSKITKVSFKSNKEVFASVLNI